MTKQESSGEYPEASIGPYGSMHNTGDQPIMGEIEATATREKGGQL